MATEQGRRFALAHGKSPLESADWALPTMFMSKAIDPEYSPTPDRAAGPGTQIDSWISGYDLERQREPVFCDRNGCFDAYYELFQGKPVLMVRGEENMGKSRLIRELTAQAVCDGHIPIVLSSDDPFWEPPRTIDELRVALIKAVQRVHEIFKLNLGNLQLVLLKNPDFDNPVPPLGERIRDELKISRKVTAKALMCGLASDLGQLMAIAYDKYETIKQANGRAVVLLDQVHGYDKEFLDGLDDVVGKGGLSDDEKAPVPLVVLFAPRGAGAGILRSAVEVRRTWLNVIDLEPFPKAHDQDLMVYRQVLLQPFNEELEPGVSDKAFAINEEAPEDKKNNWYGVLRTGLRGIPGRLADPMLYACVKAAMAMPDKILIEADDNRLLKEMRQVSWTG